MTNRDMVLEFLQGMAPKPASNAEIRARTGIKPHQTVFMITRELMNNGLIHGRQLGKEWMFWVDGNKTRRAKELPAKRNEAAGLSEPEEMGARTFEALARDVLSRRFGTSLRARSLKGVPKLFDLVSDDGSIVGDAKFYTLVGGERLPPAKFSVVAEYVWFMEKTKARHRFIVFGNDRRVPEMWLSRYGHLTDVVEFLFLSNDGELEVLKEAAS